MEWVAKKYQKLTQLEHILKRPGMYIGGIEPIEKNVMVYRDNKIINQDITYSPGLYKIFDELIVNAYDQTTRDSSVKNIKVNIDLNKNEITVYNDGKGIDVVIHPIEKIYVPELIFGHFLTSTSFDHDTKQFTGGIHGLGAKLTAVFSKYFKVEIGDSINMKKFSQYYKNNLSIKSKPIIQEYKKKHGYVEITYIPDLKYFGLQTLDPDIISLMERRVYDIAALVGKNVHVYLNDVKLPVTDIGDYVRMITNGPLVTVQCDETESGYVAGRWNVVVTRSIDGSFNQISFVNGINTMDGGYHVNYIVGMLVKGIKNYIQSKYKTTKIKDHFIRDQLQVVIAAIIENPTFSSQTKNELMTPVNKFGSTCVISDRYVKKVYNVLELDTVIQQQINALQNIDMTKLIVKKKSSIRDIPKLYDANHAGTNRSSECALILTEGDSAKTMAISGLGVIPKANNFYGVFPLKGKLLNVRDAPHKKIIANEEFKNLQNIIGLRIGEKYTVDNITELRYGSVILMMDADVDGSHIKGLFINMIAYYWPSLLMIDGWIKIFITPVIKATYRNNVKSFYSINPYTVWKNQTADSNKWQIKYYKGLGTNTSAEAKEYFSNLDEHIVNLHWTENSIGAINLAFDKTMAGDRKLWLKKYDPEVLIDYTTNRISYFNFIHKELIHFSNYDNIRSIPNVMDGLKPSQRKVLYSALKKDLVYDIKVAQFVGYIGEHTAYHHGEISLINTIIGMAQDYVGSNNINLLMPKGQFGTRLMGGKDHSSARYIYTRLEKVTRLIYRKEDDELLEYLEDDGVKIEPQYYIPVIPMVLVNGADGIGTGYSTNIPKYNPRDIIHNIKLKLNGEKSINMTPWYRGFTGNIIKVSGSIYYTKGLYTKDVKKNKYIHIHELPVGFWTEKYVEGLRELADKYPFIKNIMNNSSDTSVDIVIKFDDYQSLSEIDMPINRYIDGLEKFLSLVTTINLSNMHMYNNKIEIMKYENVRQIIDEFYDTRMGFYTKRKKRLLEKLNHTIQIFESKIKFIQLIVDGKLMLINQQYAKIIKILEKHKLFKQLDEQPFDYLLKMPFHAFTKEKIDELNEMYVNKKNIYEEIEKKDEKAMWLDDLNELEYELYGTPGKTKDLLE
jgi:DNA topoisomerase II